MAVESPVRSTEEVKAATLLRWGGTLGVASGLLALAAPWALFLAASGSAGPLALNAGLLGVFGVLALGGSVGFLVTFLLYRRAFVRLRHADRRLRAAVVLCRLGSIGTLALVVGSIGVLGAPGSLVGCFGGAPSHLFLCVRSISPAIAGLAVAGVVLTWIGGAGVVVGLLPAGRHYRGETLRAAAVVYAILLAVLLLPLAGVLFHLPGATYSALAVAVAGLAAPALVRQGARVRSGKPTPSRA